VKLTAKISALLLDGIIGSLAFYFAYVISLREMGPFLVAQFSIAAVVVVGIKLVCLLSTGLYHNQWILSGMQDVWLILKAVFFVACFSALTWLVVPLHYGLPVVIIVFDVVLTAALLIGVRSSTSLFDFLLERVSVFRPVTEQQARPAPVPSFVPRQSVERSEW
jgi:FlaA1/EpsC-like NDP-sugar epimerase